MSGLFSLQSSPSRYTYPTAYERQNLTVTTNLPFENWLEVLGSERLTDAALDRVTHRCHILVATGESYRLQDAQKHRRKESQE